MLNLFQHLTASLYLPPPFLGEILKQVQDDFWRFLLFLHSFWGSQFNTYEKQSYCCLADAACSLWWIGVKGMCFRAIYNLCFSVHLWYSWNIVLKLLYNSAIKVFPLLWIVCFIWWNVHSNRWNIRSNGWNVRSKPWNILFIVDKKLFQCG